jgi:hypothetical protein
MCYEYGCKFKSMINHIKERCINAITSSYTTSNLHSLSIKIALKLFHLKTSPIASYGIELIWPYLSVTDLTDLESVKSRFLKRALCLSKYTKSRLVYELTNEDFLLKNFKLNSTCLYLIVTTNSSQLELIRQKI